MTAAPSGFAIGDRVVVSDDWAGVVMSRKTSTSGVYHDVRRDDSNKEWVVHESNISKEEKA